MFRSMRRFRQELSSKDTVRILESGSHGVLAVLSDGGYPYAVPLSYVYADGKLYFHCAVQGHKLDALQRNSKASFCVVTRDAVVPERITSIYESAIAFGQAKVVKDDAEKRSALRYLAQKYSASNLKKTEAEIDSGLDRVCVVALEIEHLTGKASMDIINAV